MAYFFDSYGEMPNTLIKKYLSSNFNRVYFNSRKFQSYFSNVCGHYVLVFIYLMSKGFDFEFLMQLLNRTNNPDEFVYEFVKNNIE